MNIERRDFLKGLLALTAMPILVDFDLELAEEVDKAWDTLSETPFLFQVDSDGLLDDYYYDAPILRRDAYNILSEITSMNDLFYCMEWQPFAWTINSIYGELIEDLPKSEQTEWLKEIDDGSSDQDKEAIKKWSNTIGKKEFIVQMDNILQKWLDEEVDSRFEEVYVDVPLRGGSYVFDFFENEVGLAEELDIGLIEGFHPGDDSEHAMLGISIEKANEICIENDLPIRFEKA